MKKLFAISAKRALALALALVLLLSLCPMFPLTADAAVEADWQFDPDLKKYFGLAEFISNDDDLVFEDDQDFHWYVRIGHTNSNPIKLSVQATIKDSSGTKISEYVKEETTLQPNTPYSVCNYTDFRPALDKKLGGTFTLDIAFYYGNTRAAWVTKTITRIVPQDNNAEFQATSHSKPDMVFTYADPIDLQLNIKKTNAESEGFDAVTTITNASGSVVSEGTYTLPASTNIDVSVKDLVDVTGITTPGNYNVNVTLNDANGNKRYDTTIPFAVVAMDRTVTVSISGEEAYEDTVPQLSIYAQKDDGVTENCSVLVTVTNVETGSTVYSDTVNLDVSGAEPVSITPSLSSLPAVGSFRMNVVVTDNDGITRGTASHTFTRTSTASFSAELTDNITFNAKTGLIYTDSDNPLVLNITDPSRVNETLTIRYTGTYNGESLNETRDITIPSAGFITLNARDFIKYGIYENLHISICSADGGELWTADDTYTFSFVRTEAAEGGLSILNMNVHYTNISDIVHMTNQVDFSALAGASAWRSSITWDVVEKTRGNYSMPSQLVAVMEQTKRQGMQALIILAYNNNNTEKVNGVDQLIYGDPNPYNTTWLNAYADYCEYVVRYMAENYPDQVIGFEIWNEWNNASMSKVDDSSLRTGDVYAMVVKAASERIRKVNAEYQAQGKNVNFMVIGGATAGSGYLDGTAAGSSVNTFMTAFFDTEGIIDAIDGFSFHTYASKETTSLQDQWKNIRRFEAVNPTEEEFDKIFASVKARLNGANKEIWLTETSWSSFVGEQSETRDNKTHITTGVTEQQQAAYMTQLYAWALTDGTVDRIFWYDLLNDRTKKNNVWQWWDDASEHNYGVLHSWDESVSDHVAYAAKQSYVAMCAMSSMLSNASYSSTVNLGENIAAYSFTKNGQTMVVAWTTTDTTATLNCSSSMNVTDMFGNTTTGLTIATLSECPIYIVCDPGTLSVG